MGKLIGVCRCAGCGGVLGYSGGGGGGDLQCLGGRPMETAKC